MNFTAGCAYAYVIHEHVPDTAYDISYIMYVLPDRAGASQVYLNPLPE